MTWKTALESINHSDYNLARDFNSNPFFSRYALPDAHLIATPNDNGKKVAYLIAWLQARPSLIYQARKQLTLSQRLQTWRVFLEMVAPGRKSGKSETSTAGTFCAKLNEVYTFLLCETNLSLAMDSPIDTTNLSPPMWHGKYLSRNAINEPPIPGLFREVLWDLNESNFRLEFFSLDCLASEEELDPREQIAWLCACFEPNEFIPPTFPMVNTGLVADGWKWRVDAVLALVEILSSWKSCPRNLRVLDPEIFRRRREVNQAGFEDLEQRAANFYCQMFYNYFGRAPSIPCRIFSPA